MPRHAITEAFNDFIPTNTNTAGTAVFTGAHHNATLGRHNALGIHVTVDTLTLPANSAFYLFLDVSNDGRNWLQRSKPDPAQGGGQYLTGDADIAITLTSGTTTFAEAMWSDACLGVSRFSASSYGGPLLAFVRFRMFWGASGTAGHVRIHVTQRD